MTPLTAYAGQLTGETYDGKLAKQVAALNVRPPAVMVMAVFHVLFALFVPVAIFVSFLPGKASSNPDDMYQSSMSTAFHSIGAVVVGLVMLPLAGALIWLAWATWAQRTWAWTAAFAPLIVFVIMLCTKFSVPSTPAHVTASMSLLLVAVLLLLWYRPATRAWFGL